MRAQILTVALTFGAMGLSCELGEPDPSTVKVSTDAAGAQKAAGKISETAMQAYFVRIKIAGREYVATKGSYPEDVHQLVEAGLLRVGQANDPWGNPYVVKVDSGQLIVISYGADGAAGGTAENRDRMSTQ